MTARLTPDELERIRARAEAATPGPWTTVNRGGGGVSDYAFGNDVVGPPEPYARGMFEKAADAEFIAASRTDIPALLAHAAALEAELAPFAAAASAHRETAEAVWEDVIVGWNQLGKIGKTREAEGVDRIAQALAAASASSWQRCPVTGEPKEPHDFSAWAGQAVCARCGVERSAIAAPTEQGE